MLWQRDRANSAIVREWVNLRLRLRLKGYVSCQYLVILQLCRWQFSHKETLYQTLFDWNWILFRKQKNRFKPPSGGTWGNVRTPFIAHWKARGQLPIRNNWTYFRYNWWDVISGNLSKSAFFEGGGSLWAQISDVRGCHPPTTLAVRKLEWLSFVWYQNIYSALFGRTKLRQLIPR